MALSLKISGVDLIAKLVEGSLSIEQRADAFVSTASFQLIDETATLNIREKEIVEIEDGATKYFEGMIANLDISNEAEGPDSLIYSVACQDYNVLLDQVVIDDLEEYGAATDQAIIDDLFDKYLPEINSHAPGGAPPGFVQELHIFAEISFEALTLRAAMDKIATEIESVALQGFWYVDYDKFLHYYNLEDNALAWWLSDTPDYVNSFDFFAGVKKVREGSAISNRVLVVGADLALLVQDLDSYNYYGRWFEMVRQDNSLLTVDEVYSYGDSLMARLAFPAEVFEVTTLKAGARAGHNIRLDSTLFGSILFGTPLITNHLINPSFEVNVTDGWTYSQGGAAGAAARGNIQVSVGDWACAIGASDVTFSRQTSDGVVVADGEVVTVQARVWREKHAIPAPCGIDLYNVTDAAIEDSVTVSRDEVWEFLTLYWENDTGFNKTISLRLNNDRADGSEAVWFDGCQLEINKGPRAMRYIDGTLPLCSWTGVAHNSTTTRLPYYTIRQLDITWPEGAPYGDPHFRMTLAGSAAMTALSASRSASDERATGLGGPIRPSQLPASSMGWNQDIVFSATDFNTVEWAAAGEIELASGDTFTIDAGTTGDMAAATVYYIYLDLDVSATVLEVADARPSIGLRRVMVAVAYAVADADTNKAIFQTFGGEGAGVMITADNIVANTITVNEMGANSIDTGQLVAGAVEADKLTINAIDGAGDLEDGTVSETTIVGGSINTGHLQANVVTADKLSVGMVTGNLCDASVFRDDESGNGKHAGGWTSAEDADDGAITYHGIFIDTISTYTDVRGTYTYYGSLTGSTLGNTQMLSDSFIPVDTGAIYTLSAMATKIGNDPNAHLGVRCYDAAQGDLGARYCTLRLAELTTNPTRYSGTITGTGAARTQFVALTKYIRVIIFSCYQSGVGQSGSFFWNVQFEKGDYPTDYSPGIISGEVVIDGQRISVGVPGAQRVEITNTGIEGYSVGNVKQFYIQASDGTAAAGAGAVVLDEDGVALLAGAGYAEAGAVTLKDAGGNIQGEVYATDDGTTSKLVAYATGTPDSQDAEARFEALASVGDGAEAYLAATAGGAASVKADVSAGGVASVTITADTIYAAGIGDLRVAGGLYVGGVGVDPAVGEITAVGALSAGGGNFTVSGAGVVYAASKLGVGVAATYTCDIQGDVAGNYIAKFFNDGGNTRHGIIIQCGDDANPNEVFSAYQDGDGTQVGWVIGDGAGGVTYHSVSDERNKNVLGPISSTKVINALTQISPFEYVGKGLTEATGRKNIGFSAQDVHEIFPEAAIYNPETDQYTISYGRLVPVLWAQNQALLERIKKLEV